MKYIWLAVSAFNIIVGSVSLVQNLFTAEINQSAGNLAMGIGSLAMFEILNLRDEIKNKERK